MPVLIETTALTSVLPALDKTFAEVLNESSASAAGYHAVSAWLTCPEQSRLKSLGIQRKPDGWQESLPGISPLAFGTLIHHLLAVRVVHGHDAALQLLWRWQPELGAPYAAAVLMMGTYEFTFAQATEPLQFLAVEAPVTTNIRMGDADPRPCLRTVRYDAVVRAPPDTSGVYALERKTMARSGAGSIKPYYPQGMVQMALWNANVALVQQYGPMRGVIYESLVKTKAPSVDRHPVYFSPRQQSMALRYMRSADNGYVQFAKTADGQHPMMLHACWGRWRPCDYISLCHEEIVGDYQMKDGSPLPYNF